jgi:hypothetical protein
MARDFTYEMYADLLDGVDAGGLPFLTVREYLGDEPLPDGFVVLRHDVDRKPRNALDFARLEADRGIESTYYVRTAGRAFDPDVVREIASLGHEIGYHYEDVDRTDGDLHAAHRSFERQLERLRTVAPTPVDTVCMHGNPLTPHDNRSMWEVCPGFEAYGLRGEAYLSMDFTDVTYYSDTGRTWRDGALKVKDHPVGANAKSAQVDTTHELLDRLRHQPDRRSCVLTHPDRWTDSLVEEVAETAFDRGKNVAKYALQRVGW